MIPALIALFVCLIPGALASAADIEEVRAIVAELAGPETMGRAVETDLATAAGHIEARLSELGEVTRQAVDIGERESSNLMLLREPKLAGAGWIVLGAHYDHLGVGAEASPFAGEVFHGAGDNASGCAVLLAAAELLWRDHPSTDRGLAVVFFTGEEKDLLGSRTFLESGPILKSEILAMVNLDTVGRLSGGELTVFGVASARSFSSTLDGLNSVFGLPLQKVDVSSGASDDMPFIEAGIPALHLFTGAWPEYHRPSDTVETIDYEGLVLLAEFTAELGAYLADAETGLDFVAPQSAKALADPSRQTEGKRRVSFGSIPDFKYEGEGVRLSGILPGSPAAKAGLQEGDVVVGFAGAPIGDLTDYSEAMKRHSPGDVVSVEYLRDGTRATVEVTLAERK